MKTYEKNPNEIPKYRKRSQKHGTKKSDHKHEYKSCVYKVEALSFNKAHGFANDGESFMTIGTYCPICGKIGTFSEEGWNYRDYSGPSMFPMCYTRRWTERAEREFNESTRTLPFFRVKSIFEKRVDIRP